jgi:large subunit ribosomal protein L20
MYNQKNSEKSLLTKISFCMSRVKRGRVARIRRKKVLSLRKGAIGSNSRLFRRAKQQVIKSISFSYFGRHLRKRNFRALWIIRINRKVRSYKWKYAWFIYYMRQKKSLLNRKVIAQIAILDPTFIS